MGMIVRRGENDFEPIPPGLHDAVCVNYFDLGLQPGYQGKVQAKVILLFEIAARQSNGKRFHVTKMFTASLGETAALRGFLEAWRGQAFSEAELSGFDLDNIRGKGCALNLIEKTQDNGKVFVEVAAVIRLQRGTLPLVPETSSDYVPAWVQRKIDGQIIPGMQEARQRAQAPAASRPPAQGTYSPPPEYRAMPRPARAPSDGFADDIPF